MLSSGSWRSGSGFLFGFGVMALFLAVDVTAAGAQRQRGWGDQPPLGCRGPECRFHEGRPGPGRPPFDHLVVVMMENRSFDHLFGWHPTADAKQEGLAYPDENGELQPTMPLAPDYMGCDHPDPDHSWEGGRTQVNGGEMDGFLVAGDSDEYAIGYYEEDDKPFLSALARHYTTADRYFASILGPTFPNRIFLHAAQTDRLTNSFEFSDLPTIWDRLAEEGVSAGYYYSDVSFLWLWGDDYDDISHDYDDFLAAAADGTLPSVSFVEPRFLGDQLGLSESDHPHSDIRVGDAFLSEVYHALANGPAWPRTALIVTYDEWGGFFDRVRPPRAIAPNDVDPDTVAGKALLGLRVPTVIVSPYTRGNPNWPRVVSDVFDHTSILKLIEWRWNLRPLTARDGSEGDVGNLLRAFQPRFDPRIPDLPMPEEPTVIPCQLQGEPDPSKWDLLLDLFLDAVSVSPQTTLETAH